MSTSQYGIQFFVQSPSLIHSMFLPRRPRSSTKSKLQSRFPSSSRPLLCLSKSNTYKLCFSTDTQVLRTSDGMISVLWVLVARLME
mmetsp:Transcript_11496/g.24218  ORF Transcript_11496/g.24218 Transcript_11496/m.24218 type:complete len:86 (-) Transcript_11496:298-555(-)